MPTPSIPTTALPAAALEKALSRFPNWTERDGRLHRDLRFADFATAFAFMSAVALHAQELDHHPDWGNVYDRVTIDLWTHSVGGISELDLALAQRIDVLAERFGMRD